MLLCFLVFLFTHPDVSSGSKVIADTAAPGTALISGIGSRFEFMCIRCLIPAFTSHSVV